MGLFGIKLPNLGKITGIKISPKGVKLATPKITLGDIGTIATLAAPGGNILKGLGSLSTGNIVKNLGLGSLVDNGKLTLGNVPGLLAASSTLGNTPTSNPTTNPTTGGLTNQNEILNQLAQIIAGLQPLAASGTQDLQTILNQRRDLANQALRMSNPANVQAQIDRERAQMQNQGLRLARAAGAGLAPESTGLREGLNLAALNNANIAANSAMTNAYDPASVLARQSSQLGLLDPTLAGSLVGQSITGLAGLSSLINQIQQTKQNAPPSILESLLGSLATIAPSINWAGIFK